jgi:two-component system LytT family response regulator
MDAIIIDDEKRARINLSLILKEYCPEVNIVAQCENLSQGVKAIRKLKPLIVLLDIEMPGHSGLELLDFFDENEIDFSVIFTTAYNEYAVKAFKFSAVDYLLKPIIPEELSNAIQRVKKQQLKLQDYAMLKGNLTQASLGKIAIPSGTSLIFLDVSKILFIKGEGAYSEITMLDGSKHLVSRNLRNFEEVLADNHSFFRPHKSYIVNLDHVVSYNKSDGGSLFFANNQSIPISSEKAQIILEKIKLVRR